MLVALLVANPLPTPPAVDGTLLLGLVLFFAISPFLFSQRISHLSVAALFMIGWSSDRLIPVGIGLDWLRAAGLLLTLTMYFVVMGYIMFHAFRQHEISEDLIFSGLTGFIMLGIGFAYIYDAMQQLGFVAFHVRESAHAMRLCDDDLVYFSLSCISTLGIGDITPATHMAKRLCVTESTVGVLYVAVFIGRLVGMRLEHKAREREHHAHNADRDSDT
jgi:hypothetical protein